jgi:hypothetical protein
MRLPRVPFDVQFSPEGRELRIEYQDGVQHFGSATRTTPRFNKHSPEKGSPMTGLSAPVHRRSTSTEHVAFLSILHMKRQRGETLPWQGDERIESMGEPRIVERAFGIGASTLAEAIALIGEALNLQPASRIPKQNLGCPW